MKFEPCLLLDDQSPSNSGARDQNRIPQRGWIPVYSHLCTFQARHFLGVLLNLFRNPNITSSHLFRADILYDTAGEGLNDEALLEHVDLDALKKWSYDAFDDLSGFRITRRIIRQLIPRNPQIDRPVAQTCLLLETSREYKGRDCLVIQIPHVDTIENLPWYHPSVQAVAYWYQPGGTPRTNTSPEAAEEQLPSEKEPSKISIHYQLFPGQTLPLSDRLLRTARNLLSVICTHGQSNPDTYVKHGQHDQIISQKRVQDTYTKLKAQHAQRLSANWVEKTEPSKHVFEDLGIAAYLIELWKDMYDPPDSKPRKGTSGLPPFPGFVDIGCGNGVLTEVLILSGYPGQGFDGRRRKTWATLSTQTQSHLHETLCVPQPLFDLYPSTSTTTTSTPPRSSLLARARGLIHPSTHRQRPADSTLDPPRNPWHNGLFPTGTFIISNHADELTPWTPLLASLTASPFLAIPCCSHNLSGARFRAPSAYNAHTADAAAPGYFAAQKPTTTAKSIPITIPTYLEQDLEHDGSENETERTAATTSAPLASRSASTPTPTSTLAAETGDLRALAPAQRAKQPSAYASLCNWVVHLAEEAGYAVERDQLRIPSTRNIGLVGRAWRCTVGEGGEGDDSQEGKPEGRGKAEAAAHQRQPLLVGDQPTAAAAAAQRERVQRIVLAEGADGVAWVRRCEEVLAKGGGVIHGRE